MLQDALQRAAEQASMLLNYMPGHNLVWALAIVAGVPIVLVLLIALLRDWLLG